LEQIEKIKQGILNLINKGVYSEAEELLAKYEGVVTDDPDIYNLKSIIYSNNENYKKAFEVLMEGVTKHPGNFDIHYNLAYLHEQQGELLHAFDRYILASEITTQKDHHKEIMKALEKLQKSMKEHVAVAKSGKLTIGMDASSGYEATRDTIMVDVELNKCRDNYALGYGDGSWHPFVEVLKEVAANPELKYEESTLIKYYFLFRPKSLQEALMGDEVRNISPINDSWTALPWEASFAQSIIGLEDKTAEHYFFGPYPAAAGKAEMKKLLNHYQLAKESDYHPAAFNDGYIRGYLLKTENDYRFVVCEGHHRMAALAALGHTRIRCKLLDEKGFPGLVSLQAITKWPYVKNKVYTQDAAKTVFYTFFNNNGSERAIGASLLCKDLTPEKQAALEKLGIDLKDQFNVRFFNAGLLDDLDEGLADEAKVYWQKHYDRKVDPGYYLAFKNLTGKREPRLIPHRIMRGEIIPVLNHLEMARTAYTDKNLYDKLVPTPNAVQNVLKRVRGKYFDADNNYLDSDDAYKAILNAGTDLIIKPSTTDDGIGIARLNLKGSHLYLKSKIVRMGELEKEWGTDFIVQKRIEQHPIMAKPHPASVNTLRMVTLRWKGEIRNLLAYARFGARGSVQDNISRGLSCGIKDNGEFMNYAIDRKARIYSHHPTTNYCFTDYARVPNYEYIKGFVRDLHKEVLHHDYICWDIVVGTDEQPIFLELNFWGTIWLYQIRDDFDGRVIIVK
jgi:tetratricopeptide (TPR) repeat protein